MTATPLEDVNARIAAAAKLARRKAESVTLIAVSKTQTAAAIRPLLEQGHRVFGENRVQEAQEKWPALRGEYGDVAVHLVGQLQSNKADEAVALFDVIHSLDRPRLVTALARAMDKAGRLVPCFVQVNIGEEPQKGGCALAELPELIAQARHAGIPLAGLMAVPPLDTEPAPYFALLAKLADNYGLAAASGGGDLMANPGNGDLAPEQRGGGLSMGMSGDFETAIMLGATHVRVGTALFGERAR